MTTTGPAHDDVRGVILAAGRGRRLGAGLERCLTLEGAVVPPGVYRSAALHDLPLGSASAEG